MGPIRRRVKEDQEEEATEQKGDRGAGGRTDEEKRSSFKDGFRFPSNPGERKSPGGSLERQTAEDSRRGQDQVRQFTPDYCWNQRLSDCIVIVPVS